MKRMNDELHKGANKSLFGNARELRKNATRAEIILWEELRNRKFYAFKFRRQHPIRGFIADFYCNELKLVIEVDGEVHDGECQIEYDKERTFELGELGIKVLRFKNEEVENNIKEVLNKIRNYLPSPI